MKVTPSICCHHRWIYTTMNLHFLLPRHEKPSTCLPVRDFINLPFFAIIPVFFSSILQLSVSQQHVSMRKPPSFIHPDFIIAKWSLERTSLFRVRIKLHLEQCSSSSCQVMSRSNTNLPWTMHFLLLSSDVSLKHFSTYNCIFRHKKNLKISNPSSK